MRRAKLYLSVLLILTLTLASSTENDEELLNVAKVIKNGMNETVNPCDDFYSYVCGSWRNYTPPEGVGLEGTFREITERRIPPMAKEILKQPLNDNDSKKLSKEKKWFNACMVTEQIKKDGEELIRQVMKENGGWPIRISPTDGKEIPWQKVDDSYSLRFFQNTFFHIKLVNDEYLTITSPFDTHIHNILRDSNNLSKVRNITTQLLNNFKSNDAEIRPGDVDKLLDFHNALDNIDWIAVFKTLLVDTEVKVTGQLQITWPMEYFNKLCLLLSKTNNTDIVNYIHWKFLLDKVYLYPGINQNRSEWCFEKIPFRDGSFAEIIKTRLSGRKIPLAWNITNEIRQALFTEIGKSLFDNSTKKILANIMENINIEIGNMNMPTNDMLKYAYRYECHCYSNDNNEQKSNTFMLLQIEIENSDLYNWINYKKAQINNSVRLSKNGDRWKRNIENNAAYLHRKRKIDILAGMLLSPLFNVDGPIAMNLGNLGFFIAHEIAHSFDRNTGTRAFGGRKECSWWSKDMLQKYLNKTQCLVNQYNSYKERAEFALAENIADTLGLKLAYNAFKRMIGKDKSKNIGLKGLPTLNEEQLFFVSFATSFCAKPGASGILHYASNRFRVIGPTDNLDAFAEVFQCKKKLPTCDLLIYTTLTLASIIETNNELQNIAKLIEKGMNNDVNPCDDFYSHVCGSWVMNYKPPSNHFSSWDLVAKISSEIPSHAIEILKQPSSPNDSINLSKEKQWFSACMDTENIKNEGLQLIKQIIRQNGGWPITMNSIEWKEPWQTVDESYGSRFLHSAFFDIESSEGNKLWVKMPSARDVIKYSHDLDKVKKLTTTILGDFRVTTENGQRSGDIEKLLNFHIELNNLILLITNPKEKYESMTKLQRIFDTQCPGKIDLNKLLKALLNDTKIVDVDDSIFCDFDYLQKLCQLLHKTDNTVIVNYVNWVFLLEKVYLNQDIVQNRSEWCFKKMPFNGGCLSEIVKTYLSDEKISFAMTMFNEIKKDFLAEIEKSWLDRMAKDLLQFKMTNINIQIDNPYELTTKDEFHDIEIGNSDLQNWINFRKAKINGTLIKYSEKKREIEFNTYYDIENNTIQISAGKFLVPLLNVGGPTAMNYGYLGFLMGQKLVKALDITTGLRAYEDELEYEYTSDYCDWWLDRTIEVYNEKTRCIANKYKILGMQQNVGVSEKIADTLGLKLAFNAFKRIIDKDESKNLGLEELPNLNGTQLFFVSFATSLCENTVGKTASNKFRVNGPVSNLDGFTEAFQCKTDSLKEIEKCELLA